jgi:hypothetical protein
VPGAALSATRGPLHGAHMNKSAKTMTAAIAAIAAPLMPLSRRPISSRIVFSSIHCPKASRPDLDGSCKGWCERGWKVPACAGVKEAVHRKALRRKTASVRRGAEAVIPIASDHGE